MVVPAYKGNETILASALKAGPQLKGVVITSSTIAVVDPKEPGYVFTEKDFAANALEKVLKEKGEGVEFPGGLLYAASKTASEKAVWSFRDTKKVCLPLDDLKNLILTFSAFICGLNNQSLCGMGTTCPASLFP